MTVAARASLMLVFTCACWSFSFPLMKALEQVGRATVPGESSVFFAALCTALRFTVAAILFGAFCARTLPGVTRSELWQGAGLGVFGGIGLVLQMDGMAYTLASTSAFLTQGYCVLIPLWFCVTRLRWPTVSVVGASFCAMGGAAVLARFGTEGFEIGRGEWETLAGSVLFTGQILWLERPCFRGNNSRHTTVVMFVFMALAAWPLAGFAVSRPGVLAAAYATPSALGLIALLVGVCTLITFPVSNHWQPKVSATQAGLLYCSEPVFTALVTLFVPGFLSRLTGIRYLNETLTPHLMGGGLLILVANIWLILRPPPNPQE
jgi:drug/metabolite transporter (DMT)-like permease